jgi:hypothetical protein
MSVNTATEPITNGKDIIDSRDIIARIEYLETDRQDTADQWADVNDQIAGLQDWDDEYGAELSALRAVADECDGYGNWEYGEALIRDSYFENYAQELAEDIGAINADATWPNNCIDWEQAACELQQDYMSVEFDGVTYWMRS